MKDLEKNIQINNLFLSLSEELKKSFLFISSILSQHTSRAYIVGGALRDYLLHQPINDLDIEIYDISPKLFDTLMKQIKAKNVGKSFFVYKYHNIDLALARSETKISNTHTGFEVKVEHIEKIACFRRDFTMNAMMANIFSYELLDFYDAKTSLLSKTICVIDASKFKEDSLRVLRAVQFSARLGFKCDKKSVKIMQEIDLSNISKPRIFIELEKLFYAKYMHFGWFYLVKLGVLKKIFDINISFSQFIKIYKLLKLNKNNFETRLSNFYFLYFICIYLQQKQILHSDIFPKKYKKIIYHQLVVPKKVTNKFLIALSLKYPLKDWLGCFDAELKQRAINLNVYENSFIPNTSIQDIISSGIKGDKIKKQYKKLAYMQIKNQF